MLNVKPAPHDMRGDFVTAVTEIKVWDVVLDDDGDTAVPQLVSDTTITKVGSATETSSNVWSMTLSDESSTVVTGLANTGEPDVASSTEDTDGDDRRWDCTLKDGALASPNGNLTEPIVGSFVYYLPGTPENFVPAAPTWLTMTAAEYAKWM